MNPTDTITVPVGSTIYFSGGGSSDADQPSGIAPSYYFWDRDDNVGCLLGAGCLQPSQVPPGSDAATNATDNMDQDSSFPPFAANTTADEPDASGPMFSRRCDTPGMFAVTLITWDDNHLQPFHNTLPDATYVHPQTDTHPATVKCTEPPPPPPMCPEEMITTITEYMVINDPFDSARFVGLTNAVLNVALNGTTAAITGDRAQVPNGSGQFDRATCSLVVKAISQLPIAGFSNVHVTYMLQISGPNYNTVTGTYLVGTDNTLNNEPQPVTYGVSGSISNSK